MSLTQPITADIGLLWVLTSGQQKLSDLEETVNRSWTSFKEVISRGLKKIDKNVIYSQKKGDLFCVMAECSAILSLVVILIIENVSHELMDLVKIWRQNIESVALSAMYDKL